MPCLNLQLRKFQNDIYKKQTLIAIKTNFTHKNLTKIYLCMKKNLSSLAAIFDAILYQGSLINCSQITMSHFEPFPAWKNHATI